MKAFKLDTKILETNEKKIAMWKKRLNSNKQKVATIIDQHGDRWHSKTRYMEFSHWLKKYTRNIETKVPINSSNAFYKMWEILTWLDNLDVLSNNINHFDNASFPGDFIRTLQVYTDDKPDKLTYDWVANSLLPNKKLYKTILGDRYNLYMDYPDKWLMTPEHNGNVIGECNLNEVKSKLDEMKFHPNIYTSDVGFEFIDRFNEELEHFDANYGQIMQGLHTLIIGGIFVIKMFNMFELKTRQLISQVACAFEQSWILKPQTSKPDNSEMYLCGIGYKGIEEFIPCDIPIKLENIIQQLVNSQCTKIQLNITEFKSRKKITPDNDVIYKWVVKHNLL